MSNWVDLYLELASDYRITEVRDHKITTISLEQARQIWESGRVRDFNLAFNRLVQMNWNVDAVRAFYARGVR